MSYIYNLNKNNNNYIKIISLDEFNKSLYKTNKNYKLSR